MLWQSNDIILDSYLPRVGLDSHEGQLILRRQYGKAYLADGEKLWKAVGAGTPCYITDDIISSPHSDGAA